MSEESAFLSHLSADHGDEVTRLVYADWLDDSADPRAAFLRAEQELAALDEANPRAAALDAELIGLMRPLRWEWMSVAGRRWDVWLTSFPPPLKISTIKALRELSSCGLREGKQTVEAAPVALLTSLSRGEAVMARGRLCGIGSAESGPVEAVIRPCLNPTAEGMFRCAGWCELMLEACLPERWRELYAALNWGYYTEPLSLPRIVGWYATEQVALAVAESIQAFARTRIDRVDVQMREVIVPIFADQTCEGPFAVRLLSVEPACQRQAVETAATLGVSVTGKPPHVLAAGVCGAEAERVRRIFAGLGEVQVSG